MRPTRPITGLAIITPSHPLQLRPCSLLCAQIVCTLLHPALLPAPCCTRPCFLHQLCSAPAPALCTRSPALCLPCCAPLLAMMPLHARAIISTPRPCLPAHRACTLPSARLILQSRPCCLHASHCCCTAPALLLATVYARRNLHHY
ncbi:hypothetical protein SLEP1_g53233 [Rubroshorea leprosula]|uniref:Uncharacterized protein n=1 Tax=Rubroshorea leprosula TaxID=152421 RepID=A0AAV5M8U1_9ROSI|nr:hypothetical protein SLEP1_g53233 [Rubroshorea leprosula]